jgi:hypothetical protein
MPKILYLFLALCILVAIDGRGPTAEQPLAQNAHHFYFDSANADSAAWTAGTLLRHNLKPSDRVVQYAVISEKSPIGSTWISAFQRIDSNALLFECHCPKSLFIRGPPYFIA